MSNDIRPTDLHEICERLGIIVWENCKWDEELAAPCTYVDEWGKRQYCQNAVYGTAAPAFDLKGMFCCEIRLRKRRNPLLERRVLAHEIAHILLGHVISPFANDAVRKVVEEHSIAWYCNEYAADYIARELLMPRDSFIDAFIECSGSVAAVADIFQVTPADVDKRLIDIATEDPEQGLGVNAHFALALYLWTTEP